MVASSGVLVQLDEGGLKDSLWQTLPGRCQLPGKASAASYLVMYHLPASRVGRLVGELIRVARPETSKRRM